VVLWLVLAKDIKNRFSVGWLKLLVLLYKSCEWRNAETDDSGKPETKPKETLEAAGVPKEESTVVRLGHGPSDIWRRLGALRNRKRMQTNVATR